MNGAKAGQNGAHEPQEPSGEPSDKEISTDSDLQKGETRRQRKRNAAMAHVVEGVSEQGNLLPHSKLLFRETSLPK